MIYASRRGVIAGALAVPTLAGIANWRHEAGVGRHGEQAALLYHPSLEAGRRFAAAAKDGNSLAIAGDRIRFTREVLSSKPALIAGVSRPADLLMIADVAAEAGYMEAAILHVRAGRCMGSQCQPGWGALARLGNIAGAEWAEALANYAVNPGGAIAGRSTGSWVGAKDTGLVLGWVLAARG